MLKSSDYKAYSKFIENLANKLTKFYYSKLNKSFKVSNKLAGKGYDPVTTADKAFEKFIRQEIKKRFPNHQILITCTTQTGSATIRRIYGNSVLHQYLPYDLKFFIKRFLKLWKPEITFIIETEIWPNLIDQLSKQKRKVFLVNGRLSEKSFRRYKSFLPILDNVFEKIDFTVCQGSEDLERFVELGIQENKIKNPIYLSGDRHFAEISVIELLPNYKLYDVTSSGLTHSYEDLEEEFNSKRISPLITSKNFGMINWNWDTRKIALQIYNIDGRILYEEILKIQ